MIDIVFPNKNEKQFVQIAEKLGIKQLIFVYKSEKEFYTEKSKVEITNALLVEASKVRKTQDKKILTVCKASREAIERKADIVYGFELQEGKDKTHYRLSGLNQVLCKLATRKKVKIGLSVSELLVVKGQVVTMGRMMQNIRLCTKYKTPMKIASFASNPYQMRSSEDLTALFKQLGMQPNQIKQALK